MNPLLLGIGAYIVVQFAIGIVVSRRISTETDYLLAGRRLGLALASFSIFATWFGAETVVGAAGEIYRDGLAGGAADPFGYSLCLILVGLLFAAPLWRRHYTTLADLFRERYSPLVEKLVVFLLVPTSVIWAAAQIRAFGQVVSASSGLEVEIAVTAAAALVIAYTAVGGLLADAVTDFVQSIAIIVGLAVLAGAIAWMEDVPALVRAIPPERLNPLGSGHASWLEITESWAIPICGSVLSQELVARILGARTVTIARRAALLGGGLYLLVGLIPAAIGLIAPALVPGLEHPEQVIAVLAQEHLGTFMYVLFAGALVSAILSTVDSALLAASALTAHNVVVRLRPAMSERQKVLVARCGVAVLGIGAYVLALHAQGVHDLVETASAFGTAGVFVVALFGLFTRIGGTTSALSALLAGMGVWITGHALDWTSPYVMSLAAAAGTYLLTAAASAALGQRPHVEGLT